VFDLQLFHHISRYSGSIPAAVSANRGVKTPDSRRRRNCLDTPLPQLCLAVILRMDKTTVLPLSGAVSRVKWQ
jgi:hypothetical protein